MDMMLWGSQLDPYFQNPFFICFTKPILAKSSAGRNRNIFACRSACSSNEVWLLGKPRASQHYNTVRQALLQQSVSIGTVKEYISHYYNRTHQSV